MILFPSMLIDAAKSAGMKVPADPDSFDPDQFPHFFIFSELQMCRPMEPGEHYINAKIISDLSDEEVKNISIKELISKGFVYTPHNYTFKNNK